MHAARRATCRLAATLTSISQPELRCSTSYFRRKAAGEGRRDSSGCAGQLLRRRFSSDERGGGPPGAGVAPPVSSVPEDDLEEDLEEDMAELSGEAAHAASAAESHPFGASAYPELGEDAELASAELAPRAADVPDDIEGILESLAFRKAGFNADDDAGAGAAASGADPADIPYPAEAFAELDSRVASEGGWRSYLGHLQFEKKWPLPPSPRDRPERRAILRCRGQKQGRAGEAGVCRIFDVRELHFNNLPLLQRFLKEGAMLRSRRETGLCAKCQRKVARTVGRSRHIGVLPTVETFGIFDAGPPPKPRVFHEPVAAVSKFGSL